MKSASGSSRLKTLLSLLSAALLLLCGAAVLLWGSARPAKAACGGTTNVASEADLNAAIASFNGQAGPCQFTVGFQGNIFLTASTTTVDNAAADVILVIAGNNQTLSGQFINGVRLLTVATGTTVTVQDLTLTAGNVTINGGGIHNQGNLTLSGSTVSNNSAGQEGGGLWNGATGIVTITTGTTIAGNIAGSANAAADAQGGGGIFNNGGTIRISDSTVTRNAADGPGGADDGGGGIFNDGRNAPGTVMITNTLISGNTALNTQGNGGGIMNLGDADTTATLSVSGGTIDDNHADRAGGGIETNNGDVNLDGVNIINNTTGINGGGFHSTSADLVTISGGTISGNTAGQEGGGVWNSAGGTLALAGTLIEGNSASAANAANDAQGGGGVFNNGGQMTISNATIRDNAADGPGGPDDGGGGLFNDGRNAPGTVTITDTLITGNTALNTSGNGGGILNIGSFEIATLVISGGTISANHAARAGGGIETNNGSVSLDSVSVISNTTGVNGGGFHSTGADLVTISGGTVSGNTAGQEGGGVWNSAGGTLALVGTLIEANTASAVNAGVDAQGGGGVFNNGGQLTISNATIRDNAADGPGGPDDGGGGIFNDGRNAPGTVTITDTLITGNTALNTSGNGGGILNLGDGDTTATLVISGGTIGENEASRAGGGIETNNGSVSLDGVSIISNTTGVNGGGFHSTAADGVFIGNSQVSGNTAGQEGGGIWNSATGRMTVETSTIAQNTASIANAGLDAQGGGGVFNNGGIVMLSQSSLLANVVSGAGDGDDGGGGIFNNGTTTVENSTISGNTAGNGGGILTVDDLDLSYVTINENVALVAGGGLSVGLGVARAEATIMANSSSADCIVSGGAAFTDGGYNLVEDGTCISAGSSFSGDPLLLPLDNYGGSTETHALSNSSPAVDAIPAPAGCQIAQSVDQRGITRPKGSGCDIGAVENVDPNAVALLALDVTGRPGTLWLLAVIFGLLLSLVAFKIRPGGKG